MKITYSDFYNLWYSYRKNKAARDIRSSPTRRMMIYRDLISHLHTTDLTDALITLQKESERCKSSDIFFYEDIYNGMMNSNNFYEKIKNWVPMNENLIISTAREGKNTKSDSLINSLNSARISCDKIQKIKDIIINPLIYPCTVLISSLALFIGFKYYGMDFITELVPYEKWPTSAIDRYESIGLFFDYIYLFIFFIFVTFSIILFYMKNGKGKYRNYLNSIPPFSIYQGITSYSFLISLASLTESGVHISDALKKIQNVYKGWAKNEVEEMINRMESPTQDKIYSNITEYTLDSDIFPIKIRVKVGSYASRDNFIENLDYITNIVLEDITKLTKTGSLIITMFIFTFFGFFTMQVLLLAVEPLFSIVNQS